MTTLLNFAMIYLLVCVVLALLCAGLRLLLGPSPQDRILALDTLWMCGMLLSLALGILYGSQIYFEAALIIALVGVTSTMALAKFLMRGEIIE